MVLLTVSMEHHRENNMDTYITSKDYNRLYILLKSGMKILCFTMRQEYGRQSSEAMYLCKYGVFSVGSFSIFYARYAHTREEFIQLCEDSQLEFIDPASQQDDRKVLVSYQDLLKEIPGGAEILWEENSVMSNTFMCNGEAMHEEWSDEETPLDALFRLYKRARKAAIVDEDN